MAGKPTVEAMVARLGGAVAPSMSTPAIEAEAGLMKVIQGMIDLLGSRRETLQKLPNFHVFFALVYACIDEFVAAFHLGRFHYFLQANPHLRAVVEIADKIALFRKDPSQTQYWSSEDWKVRLKEISPVAVRKKLGKEPYDDLYGYLCEQGAHLSFNAFRSRVYWRRPAGSTEPYHLVVLYAGTNAPELENMFYPAFAQVVGRLFDQVHELQSDDEWLAAIEDLQLKLLAVQTDWTEKVMIPWGETQGRDVSVLRQDVAEMREELKSKP